MGFLSSLLGLLEDFSVYDDYIVTSKAWFDKTWNRMRLPDVGKGMLIIQNGKLYRKLKVKYSNESSYIISDEYDEGCELKYVNLTKDQKDEILRNGYVVLKRYH